MNTLGDISQKLVFPTGIASTNLRPEFLLWSLSLMAAHLIQLTVPWEDSVEERL